MLAGCLPWPEDLVDRYRSEGYWRGETLAQIARGWAQTDPSRVAVVTTTRRLTYAELDQKADRLAAGLKRLGIRAADRVVVQLPNIPELVILSLALFRLGAIPVYALPPFRRNEISYLCAHAEAVAYVIPDVAFGFDYRVLAAEIRRLTPQLQHILVVGAPDEFVGLDTVEAPAENLPPPKSDEVAFFLLSGGTTGLPKLIPRTHDDYSYQLRATAAELGVDERSVYLASLPVAHNAALGCPGVLGTLRVGGRVVLPTTPSPDEVFPLVAREKVDLTTLVPSLVSLWVETAPLLGADLSRVLLQVGGAKLDPEMAARVRSTLRCRLSHWFGMAEGLLSFARLDEPEAALLDTQGHPLSAADEIRIVDEQDHDVSDGEVGQLLTRGPYTLRGYYRAESYNATAFSRDGYLRTGDLVRRDVHGNMIVVGRVKDVINRGGEKVSADELEAHLSEHGDVRASAVVAMPDSALGEKTCAFVVGSAQTPTLVELNRFLRSRGLAEYKLLDRLELVPALPLTNLGKVNKAALRLSFQRK